MMVCVIDRTPAVACLLWSCDWTLCWTCRAPLQPLPLPLPPPQPDGGTYLFLTSDQARLPAEFKHINKRRKRN